MPMSTKPSPNGLIRVRTAAGLPKTPSSLSFWLAGWQYQNSLKSPRSQHFHADMGGGFFEPNSFFTVSHWRNIPHHCERMSCARCKSFWRQTGDFLHDAAIRPHSQEQGIPHPFQDIGGGYLGETVTSSPGDVRKRYRAAWLHRSDHWPRCYAMPGRL